MNKNNDRQTDPDSLGRFYIRVLTLNCWGLWLGAKRRTQRIQDIVKYLNEHNCDIVFLQEVWVTSDYETIRDGTKDIYRFAHLFKSGSVLGSSGIVILSKWMPRVIHFEPYSLNGSPFYPWHGDWFAGKGIAYSRVDFPGLSLHLFSTHTHAYYKEDESVHDQYSVHRICQSYQLARFITFISDTACNRGSDGKDLIIVAGDMNTTSSELPYRILTSMAGLTDCYKESRYPRSDSNISFRHQRLVENDADVTDDEDVTYCHPRNSFTPSRTKNIPMKRIDFILCRLLTHGHCLVDRLSTKSMKCSTSLSDHEPVMVELTICDRTVSNNVMLMSNGISSNGVSNTNSTNSYVSNDETNSSNKIINGIEANGESCEIDPVNTPYEGCNIHVMELTSHILKQYYGYNRRSKTQLFYVVLFMLLFTLVASTYYAQENELIPVSTLVFMWITVSIIFGIGLFAGFLSYRFEQGAIEAILHDIACKMSVAKDDSSSPSVDIPLLGFISLNEMQT